MTSKKDKFQKFKHYLNSGLGFMKDIWDECDKCDKIFEDPPKAGEIKVRMFKRISNIFTDKVFPRSPAIIAKPRKPVLVMPPQPLDERGLPVVDPMTGTFVQPEPIDVSEDRAEAVRQVVETILDDIGFSYETRACAHDGFIRPAGVLEVGFDDADPHGLWTRRRSLKDVFIDPFSSLYFGQLHDCRFVGVKMKMTKQDAQKLGLDTTKIPKNDIQLEVGANNSDANQAARSEDQNIVMNSHDTGEVNERFIVWRIWCKIEREIAYLTENGDELLKNPEPWPWQSVPDFPIFFLPFDRQPDKIFGHSPMFDLQEQQNELNSLRTTMHENVVEARPITMFDKSIKDDVASAMANRRKDLWVGVDGLGARGPDAFVRKFQLEGLTRDSIEMYGLIKGEAQEISGVSENDRLEASNMTATEAQIINAANQMATGAKATTVHWFLKSTMRCIHAIIQETFTAERVAQITTPEGTKAWFTWNGPNLLGDYDLDIDATSSKSNDPEVEKQEAMTLHEVASKTPGADSLATYKELLKAFGRKDVERYIAQQPMLPPGMMPPGPPVPPGGGPGPQGVK